MAWLLFLVVAGMAAHVMVSSYEEAKQIMREGRIAAVEREIVALQYSDRHRHLLPLLRGMAEELTVEAVGYRRGSGGHIQVSLELTTLGRFLPGNKARLREKARALLLEGGVKLIDWEENT